MALLTYYNPASSTNEDSIVWRSNIDHRKRRGVVLTTPVDFNWSITHVILRFRRTGAIGDILTKITERSGSFPTEDVFGSKVYDVSGVTTASGGEDHQITFDSAIDVPVNTGFCITIEPDAIWSVSETTQLWWQDNTEAQDGSIVPVVNVGSAGTASGFFSWSIVNFPRRFIFEVHGTASSPVPTKATNPTPIDANTSVTLDQATITWDDGGGADTFDVYYGTVSGSLALVSSTQAGTSFTVTGITDGAPYAYLSTRYWRIDSTNTFGTTTGDEWSFTTLRLDPPGKTYFYSATGQYYRLLIQSDGTYGDPPGVGVENTDYVFLAAGYEANFVSTNRRLVSAANNKIWIEDI